MQNAIIVEGSRWIAALAKGYKDPFIFTVRGVTKHGIYVSAGESRCPGMLYAPESFVKLFLPIV